MLLLHKIVKMNLFAENQHQGSGVNKLLFLVMGFTTNIVHQLRQYNDLGHKKSLH